MKARKWQIYVLIDPRSQAVRYVGITFRKHQKRFTEHVSRSTTGRTHKECWIRSLRKLNLLPLVKIIQTATGDWQAAERKWIAHYSQITNLVNHTDGGEGTPGYVPPASLRAKWSAQRSGVKYPEGRHSGMLGKRHSIETIQKISAALTARTWKKESRLKLSKAHTGKTLSREHRLKLSIAHRGKSLTLAHRRKIAAGLLRFNSK